MFTKNSWFLPLPCNHRLRCPCTNGSIITWVIRLLKIVDFFLINVQLIIVDFFLINVQLILLSSAISLLCPIKYNSYYLVSPISVLCPIYIYFCTLPYNLITSPLRRGGIPTALHVAYLFFGWGNSILLQLTLLSSFFLACF